jgi:hypothetical protein
MKMPYSALHMKLESSRKNVLFVLTKQWPKTTISINQIFAKVTVRAQDVENQEVSDLPIADIFDR